MERLSLRRRITGYCSRLQEHDRSFKRNLWSIPQISKENRKITTRGSRLDLETLGFWAIMPNGESWPPGTDEAVEFEEENNWLLFTTSGNMTERLMGTCKIFLKLVKKNWKITACGSPLDLETLGFWAIMPNGESWLPVTDGAVEFEEENNWLLVTASGTWPIV